VTEINFVKFPSDLNPSSRLFRSEC